MPNSLNIWVYHLIRNSAANFNLISQFPKLEMKNNKRENCNLGREMSIPLKNKKKPRMHIYDLCDHFPFVLGGEYVCASLS